jgi:hypothetical protein
MNMLLPTGWVRIVSKLVILCSIMLVFVGIALPSLVSAAPTTGTEFLKQQQEDLLRAYSTGLNRQPCLAILRGAGGDGKLLPWAQVFNPGYWIPVVPIECVKCIENPKTPTIIECPGGNEQNVPLPANLIFHVGIRLYGFIASITVYGLVLAFAVIGIRYLVNGLSKGGSFRDTQKNLRTVSTAIIITLVAPTAVLQLLFSVLKLPEDTTKIYQACIPTSNASEANKFKENTQLDSNGNRVADFCETIK